MRRTLSAAAVLLAIAACSGDERLTEESVAGTYSAIEANDHAVPGVVLELEACEVHASSAQLTLSANGTFEAAGTGEYRCPDGEGVSAAPYAPQGSGFFEVADPQITLSVMDPASASGILSGQISGDTIRVQGTGPEGNWHSIVFTRDP